MKLIVFLKIQILFFLPILLFINCNTSKWKQKGEFPKISDSIFYGKDATVRLYLLDEDSLKKSVKELKNSLAISNEENRIEKWKEISKLNTNKGSILLFELNPETRVIPEYLDFSFRLNSKEAEEIYTYYLNLFNIKIYNQPGFYGGYPIYIGGGRMISASPGINTAMYRNDVEVNTSNSHLYHYILVFKEKLKKGDTLEVTSPEKYKFEFIFNP
ncbi:MAG: hypothetical protein KDK36_09795 [Leptospiraceae bacterium]|nr:hypothetical protein [Leptospiraceae bacterium]